MLEAGGNSWESEDFEIVGVGTCGRVNAVIHGSSHVLEKSPKDSGIDLIDRERGVEMKGRSIHYLVS